MSTVLVTGAAGYVGGCVVRHLLADPHTRVIGIDWCRMAHGNAGVRALNAHPRFQMVMRDIRDTEALQPYLDEARKVVHLAAIVGDPACAREPDLARSVNLEASERLIVACPSTIDHFIFVSTCSNYGVTDTERLATEDDDLNPISLYAETKVAVERLLSGANGNGDGSPDRPGGPIPATVLRLATVYGVAPRMRFDLTVNQFTIEALLARRLSIFGEQFWRPYVHVDDVARAILACLGNRAASVGKTFNVGHTSENYTKRMMYELLKDRLEDLEAEWIPGGTDRRSYRVSFERIRDEIGFLPHKRVPDGMDEVISMAAQGAFPDPWAAQNRNA